ncbi:MAG TPA: HAD-IA family hydrolase [Paracoccus sp. (in: a-proteobacteria)]|nr:HAD-IA family hydrolase [Paracoccus sp. (in: a-proteobacteria)]
MRLVVFDIDGTLVDSRAHILHAMARGMAAAGLPPLPDAQVLSIVGLSLPVAVATLLPRADPAGREAVVRGYRAAYQARRQDRESPLYPGAGELLVQLAGRDDLLLGVATGKSRRGLDALLAAHGLTRCFVTTQCADIHPSKPAPAMLLACLHEAGVDADRAVMVGDSSFDMQMAGNAGVAGLGVAWGFHRTGDLIAAGARSVAQDFGGLQAWIEEWAA